MRFVKETGIDQFSPAGGDDMTKLILESGIDEFGRLIGLRNYLVNGGHNDVCTSGGFQFRKKDWQLNSWNCSSHGKTSVSEEGRYGGFTHAGE